MAEQLERKLLRLAADYQMFPSGSHVLVACSGGGDSMCLLTLLWNLRQTLGITLSAAHFNHQLRPEAAEEAEFVHSWCAKQGIPCIIGTENVAAICGFGEAARLAQADMNDRADRERLLMAGFLSQLQSAIPSCQVLGKGAARLPGVAAVLLPGLDAVQAIADLDLLSVQVSGGAACRMQEGSVSPVYRGMGLSEQDARCVLRISIGRHTQKDALDYAAQCIQQVYEKRVMRK